MAEYVQTGEVLVGVVLGAFVLFMAWIYCRRRLINRGGDVLLAALKPADSAHWRMGLLRVSESSLDWFPAVGVTTRSAYSWSRLGLDLTVLPPSDAPVGAKALLGQGDTLRIAVQGPAASSVSEIGALPPAAPLTAELALRSGPYTAVRSWAEAGPPSRQPFEA